MCLERVLGQDHLPRQLAEPEKESRPQVARSKQCILSGQDDDSVPFRNPPRHLLQEEKKRLGRSERKVRVRDHRGRRVPDRATQVHLDRNQSEKPDRAEPSRELRNPA